ncbi:hypothetical protein ACHAWF_014634 [Thalassiosira exigua]
MKSASPTGHRAKKPKPAARRVDRGVPFDEMRRLMRVYGSLKCLRKRQASSGDDAKIDSVKRKFYRWFPDLEERFMKSEEGVYVPKLGHEAELRFRQESRMKDGETLTKKRATCRQQRHSSKGGKGKGKRKATRAKTKPVPSTKTNEAAPVRPNFTKPVHLPPKSVSPDVSKNLPFLVHRPGGARAGIENHPGKNFTSPTEFTQGILSTPVINASPVNTPLSPSVAPPPFYTENSRVKPKSIMKGMKKKSAEEILAPPTNGTGVTASIDTSASVVSDSASSAKIGIKQVGQEPIASANIDADEDMLDSSFDEEEPSDISVQLQFDHDLISSADIVAGTEPLDRTFIAQEDIFDDVEKDFYGARLENFRSITLSSSSLSSDDHDASISSEIDSIAIEGVIEKSIEECCEEILGSEDNDSMTGYIFDIMST